jgi:hypothetical protein
MLQHRNNHHRHQGCKKENPGEKEAGNTELKPHLKREGGSDILVREHDEKEKKARQNKHYRLDVA